MKPLSKITPSLQFGRMPYTKIAILSTALARPLIANLLVEAARRVQYHAGGSWLHW